jgi:hypothetical protein
MASALSFLKPTEFHVKEFYGEGTLTGTLTVQVPEGAKRILHASGQPSSATSGDMDVLEQVTSVIAADGKSVTFYGWKPTGTGDTTRTASTGDKTFRFRIVCATFE